MNLQDIMKQAQAMQKDMMKAKDEVDNTTFTGESSFVKVEVKGTKEITKITIEEDLSDIDKDMLADMVMIAINDAFKKVDKMMEKKLGRYANALPGVF